MSSFQKRDSRNAVKAVKPFCKAVKPFCKAVKPFCKVCHDAGKPESEYTSHFVKDIPGAGGVVVCPTLLAQECGYCHTAGHTVSYCKLLKQHQKSKEHYNRKCDFLETQSKTAVPATKQNKSTFDALAEDSDDEIDAKVVKEVCDFPALCEIKHLEKPKAISYANMASKPAVSAGNTFADAFQVAQVQPKKTKTKTKTIVTHNVSRRWVDMMSDSEDDDDDEMSISEISNDCW
jgi:hypothetical protein